MDTFYEKMTVLKEQHNVKKYGNFITEIGKLNITTLDLVPFVVSNEISTRLHIVLLLQQCQQIIAEPKVIYLLYTAVTVNFKVWS